MSAVQPELSSNLSVANGRPIEALQAVPDSYTIRRKPLQGALGRVYRLALLAQEVG